MNEDLLLTFFNNSPTAYSIHKTFFDENHHRYDYEYIAVNDAYKKLMEIQDLDILSKSYYEVIPPEVENEIELGKILEDTIIKNPKSITTDIYLSLLKKWIRIKIFPLNANFFGCIYYDATKEYLQDEEIEGFLKVNIDLLCVADTDGNFIRVNKAFEETLGYSVEELEGRSFTSLIHIEDVPSTVKAMKNLRQQESITHFVNRFRTKEGKYRYLEWNAQPNGKYIYASARDITKTRKLEMNLNDKNKRLTELTKTLEEKNKKLNTLATTDDLTGLYNRHFLNQRIGQEMNEADETGKPLSMAILDVDHFKSVNDTWGHLVGDEILKETTRLVKTLLRPTDYFVRLGGEEFLIIMPRNDLHEAYEMVENIRKTIADNQFPIVGFITTSLGVAQRNKNETFYDWYNRADQALYVAKKSGRNRSVKGTASTLQEMKGKD
ncbi:hypothetical protein MTP04_34980 [Lysinibacillus sp. PLM2]|nr:hypothetical protein MTP04_34980 [Lysinibacillus sp. PLM2]